MWCQVSPWPYEECDSHGGEVEKVQVFLEETLGSSFACLPHCESCDLNENLVQVEWMSPLSTSL